MNKQELIEKIKKAIKDKLSGNYYREVDNYGRTEYEHYTEGDAQSVANDIILDLEEDLKQLDEPQKPVVPQFVADYIEEYRGGGATLYEMMDSSEDEVYTWLFGNPRIETENERQLLFAQAYAVGYEVEKEPLYYIKLFVPTNPVVGLYLGFNTEGKFDHSYGKPHITWGWKYTFTEAEIKAIDERYWAFAVPVDEVEEG
ncbi:DUF1642 domain-containing protein [Enterococcus thailandicus]|uniref:DUF1642 domain-containing protein n=1 Tax=Enterococcus thailandicus TaxID=417368 RepID=UPI003BC16B26